MSNTKFIVWIILIIYITYEIIVFVLGLYRKKNFTFKDWVKHPEKRGEIASEMIERQMAFAEKIHQTQAIKAAIMSLDNITFFKKLPEFKTEDELNAALKKIVSIGGDEYYKKFEELCSHVKNKEYYIKEGLLEISNKSQFKTEFYKNIFKKFADELKIVDWPSEESLDILWLINKEEAAKILKNELTNITARKFSKVLESYNRHNVILEKVLLLKLFDDAYLNLNDEIIGDSITEIVRNLSFYNDFDYEQYAFKIFLNKNIDKFASQQLADVIGKKFGIENIDQYMSDKYKKEMKRSFPFEKADSLFRYWSASHRIDSQVDNGGFEQFFSNEIGYQFIDAINAAKESEDILVYQLLLKVKNEFDKFKPLNDYSSAKLSKHYDSIDKKLSEFDNIYYSISSKFEARVKLLLISKIKNIDLLSKIPKT